MIRVENIAKCYRIKKGERQDSTHDYSTLRDDLTSGIRKLLTGKVGLILVNLKTSGHYAMFRSM